MVCQNNFIIYHTIAEKIDHNLQIIDEIRHVINCIIQCLLDIQF